MKPMLFALVMLLISGPASAQVPQEPPASSVSTSERALSPAPKPAFVIPPEKANPVRIIRFEKPPVIDGKLDDEAWKTAAVLKDFYQVNPGDNIAPSKQTEVLIGYDAKTLYIAFRASDDAGKVRATVPKRDNIFADDYVGVYLDTFHDQRKAYALFFSPLGVQADGTQVAGTGEDYSLDIVMESKGTVNEDGFIIEVAIPFKSLRYEAGKGKIWGAHFFRRIKRFDNELDSWMPISRDISGDLIQAGRLTGFEGISTERTIEIIPSLTVSETGRRVGTLAPSRISANPGLVDPGRFVNSPVELDPGLSVKLGITPTVTLDFAANPDFAQVEADQPVVTANQRFPIFFGEKRPFFLEGIDIFQTPIRAVHTRAIIDPDYAVKLTGKQGRNTFGLLLASDNAPGDFSEEEKADPDFFNDISKFVDKNAYIGVLRLKRDIGKESSVGLLATSYNFIEKHNQLGGIDGRFRIDPKTVFTFQVLGTASRRFFPDRQIGEQLYRTGNGFGYSLNLGRGGRNWITEFDASGRTRDYVADVGFTPRTDTNRQSVFIRYGSDPRPKATFISWNLHNFSHANYDWRGRMQIAESEYFFNLNLSRQTFIGGGYEWAYERLFEEEFGQVRTGARRGAFFGPDSERSSHKHHFFVSGGTTPSKKYSFFGEAVYRQGHLDLDFGAGPKYPRVSPSALLDPNAPLDPGPGNLLELAASAVYQPTGALRTSLDYTRNRLVRHDTGRVAFDDNIYSVRSTYQFTRFLFARARVDYTTLSSRMRGQFLLGWAPNPGTSFYAGYNDDLARNGFSPFSGQLEPGFRRNGRTFFIKMSYLFQYGL